MKFLTEITNNMRDDRYQHQNFWVKTYRWWRYMPYYRCKAVWVMLHKNEDDLSCGDIWAIYTGIAQAQMNYLYYWDEEKEEFH